jgi:hypothetical protein
MDNNIQNMFFEKNNLKKMNDAVLQRMNLTNSSPEQKRYIIEILINNMKLVWQKIDKTKINQTNFNTILNQFNTYSFNSTIKELQEKIKPQNHEPSSLKFERDFLSTPQNPVQVPQRSQPTKQNVPTNNNNNSIHGPNSYYMEEAKKAQQLASQFEPEINSLFRPIAPTIPEEASFNNYNFNKGGKDIKKRLDDVKSVRDNETYISKRALFAEIKLDRFESDKHSFNEAFCVIEYQNKSGEIYYNYSFKLNDYPHKQFKVWETFNYSVELRKIESPNDTIRIYVWNQSKAHFYLDNVQIELFSIN